MLDPLVLRYRQLAQGNPGMLTCQVPDEVLAAVSAVDEPTPAMLEFFRTGHLNWLEMTYGIRIPYAREEIEQAIIDLWVRACVLHTSRLLGRPSPDDDQPFFSDAGLYR